MVTNAQILALFSEAASAGDLEQLAICALAIEGRKGLEDAEAGTAYALLLDADRTQEWARAECERVIADAAARGDS